MFDHHIFTLRFWLIALSLVVFVVPSAYAMGGESPPTLLLPTNQELSSAIKVVKEGLPDDVEANKTITYTIKVTNITKNRHILDVVVYEILPSGEDFEYRGASPSPIRRRPVVFRDLDKPQAQGGSPLESRILTFRWDNDRIFSPGETRKITVTGIVKKPSADVKALFPLRFCSAAHYVMGFCKGVTRAELKLFKQFVNIVPNRKGKMVVKMVDKLVFNEKGKKVRKRLPDVILNGASVPKYPNVCGKVLPAAKKVHACLAEEECLKCTPRDPERCTFGVQIWAQNTGTAAISNIKLNDELAAPLILHKTGKGEIGPTSMSPSTLLKGETTREVTHTLRAVCLAGDVGTSAQAISENPALKVKSGNIAKINVTSSDLVVSAETPKIDAGTRVIQWTITLENRGNRAAQNVKVEANFSSRGVSGFALMNVKGVRGGSNVTWKVPHLEAKGTRIFNVEQKLDKAKGSATVEVKAMSDCDCDKVVGNASSINYAMVVEMIDLEDPFRPEFGRHKKEDTIPYRLTLCNQVRPAGNKSSAFNFSFTGGLYGPDESPAKDAVNSYYVKFRHIARLNDEEEVGGKVRDPHYRGVTKETTFSKEWEWENKFLFGSTLKGRHCAKFDIYVRVNENLANGKHSLHIDTETKDIAFTLEAKETEPTTIER
jgi:uncharacterized repeat protein (TIGR01451 family)